MGGNIQLLFTVQIVPSFYDTNMLNFSFLLNLLITIACMNESLVYIMHVIVLFCVFQSNQVSFLSIMHIHRLFTKLRELCKNLQLCRKLETYYLVCKPSSPLVLNCVKELKFILVTNLVFLLYLLILRKDTHKVLIGRIHLVFSCECHTKTNLYHIRMVFQENNSEKLAVWSLIAFQQRKLQLKFSWTKQWER